MEFGVWGSRFGVPRFGLRDLGSEFRVPGFRLQDPGSEVESSVSGSGFRIPGFGFRVPGYGFRDLGSGIQNPGSGIRVSKTHALFNRGEEVNSDLGFRISDLGTGDEGCANTLRWRAGYHIQVIAHSLGELSDVKVFFPSFSEIQQIQSYSTVRSLIRIALLRD